MGWKILKLENGFQFLACYSKQNDSIYHHETLFLGKIRYLFLTYQKCLMVFSLVFSKYFWENMGFLYTPSIQWPMEAHSNGSKRYVYDIELKLRLCIKSVYNIKSLALTLSFPQAFTYAATERRVQLLRKFKPPEYYDIPKPQPGSPYSSSNGSRF